MGGLFGNRYIACFFNEKGEFLQDLTFLRSFKKNINLSFNTKKHGTYFIKGSPAIIKGLFFDKHIYNYEIRNPNPIRQTHFNKGILTSTQLNSFLKNDLLEKLLQVRKKGWGDLLSGKNLVIIAIIVIVVLWLLSGGDIGALLEAGQEQLSPPGGTG